MTYLYLSHFGSFYTTDKPVDKDELYCETCGDWDQFIGKADNAEELWSLMAPECSFFGSGGVPLSSACYCLAGQVDDTTDLEILAQIANYLATN